VRLFIGLVLLLVLILVAAWVIQVFVDVARLGYALLKPYNLTAPGFFEQGVSVAMTWGFNAYIALAVVVILLLIIFGAAALRREEL